MHVVCGLAREKFTEINLKTETIITSQYVFVISNKTE